MTPGRPGVTVARATPRKARSRTCGRRRPGRTNRPGSTRMVFPEGCPRPDRPRPGRRRTRTRCRSRAGRSGSRWASAARLPQPLEHVELGCRGVTAEPRPAASLILLRRGGKHRDRGVEILLVRRTPEASFMPGVWVFPGGSVDAADAGADDAAPRAGAVRELQEGAGIELEAESELVAWSRWITPEPVPVRFDTRFYVALAPAHSPPRPDGRETTDGQWCAPAGALEPHRAGELEGDGAAELNLVSPTIKHLESLLPYSSPGEVLEAARGRAVEPVIPRVVGEGDDRRIVLPGEPGY